MRWDQFLFLFLKI